MDPHRLTIFDSNNWFRRRAETDMFGTPVRSCFREIQRTPGIVICCWDGVHSLKPRRDIYPEYKSSRKPAGENIYESQRLFQEILQFSKAISIRVDGYEADDVIAHLAMQYKDKYSIFINSNDLDLYQLGCPMARENFPDEPQWIKLYKTLVGDNSDNIPGCKGFGKETWRRLTDDNKQVLESILVSGHALTENELRIRLEPFLKTALVNKLSDQNELKLLRLFYKIIGFIAVPDELIAKSIKTGLNKPELAEPILEKFML